VTRGLVWLSLATAIGAMAFLGRASDQQTGSSQAWTVTAPELQSTEFHGTIDVVVATKDGFVLATDSRITSGNDHSDDGQKAFPVGKQAGCVIAGLVGAELNMQGFRLRDALGSHIASLDKFASLRSKALIASDIAKSFGIALQGVAGLLLPVAQPTPGIVGAISAVSVPPEGEPEWISLYIPLTTVTGPSRKYYYGAGTPLLLYHPLELGLRFDVEALGYPSIVQRLMRSTKPSDDSFSETPIMKEFYKRKRRRRLDDFSLDEGIELAMTLVKATIAEAPPSAGVGGPIDVLVVTKEGTRWIHKKGQIAPFPEDKRARIFFGFIGESTQALDGLECVRCTFQNTTLTYAGKADVELLGPEIEGTCTLKLLQGARQKMPAMVKQLTELLGGRCNIVE
jgi:hypothetical protein